MSKEVEEQTVSKTLHSMQACLEELKSLPASADNQALIDRTQKLIKDQIEFDAYYAELENHMLEAKKERREIAEEESEIAEMERAINQYRKTRLGNDFFEDSADYNNDEAGEYDPWSDLQGNFDSDLLAALEHDGNASECLDNSDDITDEDIEALFGDGDYLGDDSVGDYQIVGDDDFFGEPLIDLDKIIASRAQGSVESYLPDNNPVILGDLLGTEKEWRIRFGRSIDRN